MIVWKRLYPGHYMSDDDRYEIVRTHHGWEFSDPMSGYSGVAGTLREAKTALEEH